jgi:hypothetical protein
VAKSKGVCWMCGRAGPLSEEHAFPDWLRLIFVADGADVALSDVRTGLTQTSTAWTNKSGEVTVRSVCKDCNNRWMCELEGRCRPVLTPLVTGHRATLGPDEQALLATWAVKTAWIFHSRNPATSASTPQQRLALATRGQLPPGARVTLAGFQEAGDTVLCANWHVVGSSPDATDPDVGATTLVLGRVVLQVVQGPDDRTAGPPPASGHPRSPTAVHQLHPTTTGPVDWPPGPPLTHEDLDAFCTPPGFADRPWAPLPPVPEPADGSAT